MSVPFSVNGFTVLPVSYSSSSTHYIYTRAHASSKKASTSSNIWPNGRTLFMANVPPDATERDLILFLKPYGTVERVLFDLDGAEDAAAAAEDDSESEDEEGEDVDNGEEDGDDDGDDEDQPRKRRKLAKRKEKMQAPKVVPLPSQPLRNIRKTGQTAHVVFLDSSSLDKLLSKSHTKPRPWPNSPEEPSGFAHYTALYDTLRPPLDSVREHADSSVRLYEFELAKTKQKSKYKKGEAIVDEDGFTLVTRGGAYGQTLGGGVAVATKKFQASGESSERGRKKKKEKEKNSFYAFQKAEKQRNHLLELKKNWELDKAKVEKLKASRRFKPY